MTVVSPSPAIMPSILSMVQRVKRECGLPEPTTLVGTTDKAAIVTLDSLNDASIDIYGAARWEWKESLYALTLVTGTSQYPLPADFKGIVLGPTSAGYPVKGLTQEEWYQAIPNMTIQSGQPQYYSVHGYIFEIWPPPSADYIAQYPTLPFKYYREAPSRLDGSDDTANINIPTEFVECLISFGKWKLKLFLEYPDAQVDYVRFKQILESEIQNRRSMRKAPRMRMGGSLNNKIWS